MIELLILCFFLAALVTGHVISAIIYKITTKSDHSIWYIMDHIL